MHVHVHVHVHYFFRVYHGTTDTTVSTGYLVLMRYVVFTKRLDGFLPSVQLTDSDKDIEFQVR